MIYDTVYILLCFDRNYVNKIMYNYSKYIS